MIFKIAGNINWLWPIIGLTIQELSNLFQTLQGDKNLNSPIKLQAEDERKLALEKEITGYTCGSVGSRA